MKLYLVGYDLIGKPEKDYEELIEAIKSIDKAACHELDSTWLVFSSKSASEIRTALEGHLHQKDKLMVVEITKDADWSTLRLPQTAAKLKANA